MLNIKIEKDPFDENINIYRKSNITIQEGVTILVGCNGSGKTTLLKYVESYCKKNNIPFMKYDNLSDGGSKAISESAFHEDFSRMANLFTASEGEAISNNIGHFLQHVRRFIISGELDERKNKIYNVLKALKKTLNDDSDEEEQIQIPNKRVLICDAIDSGFSIDNIIEFKDVLQYAIEDAKNNNVELYIIISANSYEMADCQNCFDVTNCRYVKFADYEAYRQFILDSRLIKDRRYE